MFFLLAGNLLYTFGRRCYHAIRFKDAVAFTQKSCEHITRYCQLTGEVSITSVTSYISMVLPFAPVSFRTIKRNYFAIFQSGYLMQKPGSPKQFLVASLNDTLLHFLVSKAQNNQWRKFEILSDAHRRLHQYRESLQVIADSLFVAPDQLSDAVELWVKFKVESYKWIEDKSILDW